MKKINKKFYKIIKFIIKKTNKRIYQYNNIDFIFTILKFFKVIFIYFTINKNIVINF